MTTTRKSRMLGIATLVAVGSGALNAQDNGYSDWFPGTSSVLEDESIPIGYRGTWAPSQAQCHEEFGVSLIKIYHHGIDFYESGARLRRITQSGQDRTVLARLEFEGEGQFWEREMTLMLSVNKNTLVIRNDELAEGVTYVRCS